MSNFYGEDSLPFLQEITIRYYLVFIFWLSNGIAELISKNQGFDNPTECCLPLSITEKCRYEWKNWRKLSILLIDIRWIHMRPFLIVFTDSRIFSFFLWIWTMNTNYNNLHSDNIMEVEHCVDIVLTLSSWLNIQPRWISISRGWLYILVSEWASQL